VCLLKHGGLVRTTCFHSCRKLDACRQRTRQCCRVGGLQGSLAGANVNDLHNLVSLVFGPILCRRIHEESQRCRDKRFYSLPTLKPHSSGRCVIQSRSSANCSSSYGSPCGLDCAPLSTSFIHDATKSSPILTDTARSTMPFFIVCNTYYFFHPLFTVLMWLEWIQPPALYLTIRIRFTTLPAILPTSSLTRAAVTTSNIRLNYQQT
jgi:hypothetical protein